NFLAAYVLQNVNPSNITELKVAGNISHTLDNYMAGMPDPLNQYMILTAGVFAFYASSNYDVTNIDGATIGITLNNGTTALSPNNYADIAFLEALYYNGLGQRGAAVSLFDIGASMYDGIGLKDVAFNGTYQTYKLALYIYAAKVLGENYASSAEVNLLDMKASNGGFYSGYNSNYSAAGTFTNVETTSLAVLALSVPNAPTSQVPFYESVDGVLEASLLLITVVGVLFFGSCLMRRLKR
ncbi:MAG: hypothetical protein ABSE82_11140, partial [Nitrososphaerales archaeon]